MNDKAAAGKKGGLARKEALEPNQRKSIAQRAAAARWGKPMRATHMGNFEADFGFDVSCYVLDDAQKTPVISQRGMGEALGMGKSGSRLPSLVKQKRMAPFVGEDLARKLDNPLIFQAPTAGGKFQPATIHGYDATILIDLCRAIVQAEQAGQLHPSQDKVARQAHVVLTASAKAGIRGLVYALAGYDATRQEVIEAFKAYVQEEAKKYEQEFPTELYAQWHRLYQIPVLAKGRSWHFKHLTVNHIYYPLAKSNGRLLKLLRDTRDNDGDRTKKLFQFLNEVGARALRMQLGRVLEMCESSKSQTEYENKIAERFGGQQALVLGFEPPRTNPK